MITLYKKNIKKNRNLGIGMLFTAGLFLVWGLMIGSFGYFEIGAIGGLLGGGLTSTLGAGRVGTRYDVYFKEGSVKTLNELAKELGIREKSVATDLQFLTNRADARRVKKCENVKFEA